MKQLEAVCRGRADEVVELIRVDTKHSERLRNFDTGEDALLLLEGLQPVCQKDFIIIFGTERAIGIENSSTEKRQFWTTIAPPATIHQVQEPLV